MDPTSIIIPPSNSSSGGTPASSSSAEMTDFLRALKKDPERRTYQDVQTLYFTLRSFTCLSPLPDTTLYTLCAKNCHYLRKQANDILYCRGEIAQSWFILISGSVFIDGSMFLPITSFGRRPQAMSNQMIMLTRRPNECLILEPSEMICIDYFDDTSYNNNKRGSVHSQGSVASSNDGSGSCSGGGVDDTSSAYSGSDTMLSHSSPRHSHHHHTHSHHSSNPQKSSSQIDLSGLLESVVDDDSSSHNNSDSDCCDDDDSSDLDSEDDSSSLAYSEGGHRHRTSGSASTSILSTSSLRDSVRDSLEKDPSERTATDIAILLDFTQHLAAFNDLTLTVRKSLCASMVFAVVEKAGTVVLSDGEELDSWSVLVNGSVEIVRSDGEDSKVIVLSAGDSFGLPPTLDKQYFHGLMRTRVDDCQFVCVTQGDYFRILKQGLDNQKILTDPATGKPILVYESRQNNPSSTNNSVHSYYSPFIAIRGTKQALINELFKQENGSVDPTFVEDFLLTQRIFMDIRELAKDIILNFQDVAIRDRVTRVMLLWVNNHFIDFEVDGELMGLLQRFQSLLTTINNQQQQQQQQPQQQKDHSTQISGQLRLLQIACSAKSRPRTLTIPRQSRDDPLPFNIMGGADNGYGVFVSSVEEGEKINNSIRVGDEILSVNNVNFRCIHLSRAFEVLKGSTHLVVVVKCNFLGHHECITSSATPLTPSLQPRQYYNQQQQQQQLPSKSTTTPNNHGKHKSHLPQLNPHSRFKKALQKISFLPKKSIGTASPSPSTPHSNVESAPSNPKIDFPENVLKIYKNNNQDISYKYFLVNKETTSREVVMLCLQEFPDLQNKDSRDYSLFQVSVNSVGSNGQQQLMLKQTKLPDGLDSLAERLQLGGRYYIKRVDCTEPLVGNENLGELWKESQVGLLGLNPVEVALQLTLEDYACFRQIEPTEFIDDLFNLKTAYGTPNLSQFAQLVNRETFWVVTEIVREPSVAKRVLIIKRFIKIALQCKECRNFNSMFAILSGLGHGAVTRLKSTWERLGGTKSKWGRVFKDLTDLMDPSRNMYRYRALLSSSSHITPMIPFYPVVKKDLTFIDLGNSTFIDSMVNFEKMRMVAKEIRSLIQMSAAPFDTSGLASVAAMNQLTHLGGGGSGNISRALTTTTGKKLVNNSNKKKSKRKHLMSGILPPGGGGVTHEAGAGSSPNPKKMYQEMNMIRKVKAYLKGLEIIEDENKLYDLSGGCDGGGTTFSSSSSSGGNKTLGRKGSVEGVGSISLSGSTASGNNNSNNRSPTLSTKSGGSNKGNPKFGVSSYQKLMALSEPSLNKKHPKQQLTMTTTTTINNSLSGSMVSIVSGSSTKSNPLTTVVMGPPPQPQQPPPPTTLPPTATTAVQSSSSNSYSNNSNLKIPLLSTESSSILPATKK